MPQITLEKFEPLEATKYTAEYLAMHYSDLIDDIVACTDKLFNGPTDEQKEKLVAILRWLREKLLPQIICLPADIEDMLRDDTIDYNDVYFNYLLVNIHLNFDKNKDAAIKPIQLGEAIVYIDELWNRETTALTNEDSSAKDSDSDYKEAWSFGEEGARPISRFIEQTFVGNLRSSTPVVNHSEDQGRLATLSNLQSPRISPKSHPVVVDESNIDDLPLNVSLNSTR